MLEIRYVGEMQRLRLEPGDALVLSLKGQISDETARRLRVELEAKFPETTILVLGDGAKVGAVNVGQAKC